MITGLSLPETGDQRLMNFTLARPNIPGQGKLSLPPSLSLSFFIKLLHKSVYSGMAYKRSLCVCGHGVLFYGSIMMCDCFLSDHACDLPAYICAGHFLRMGHSLLSLVAPDCKPLVEAVSVTTWHQYLVSAMRLV